MHQDLAALGVPSLDERHATLIVLKFRLLVVLLTYHITHAQRNVTPFDKKKQITNVGSVAQHEEHEEQ